MNQTSDQASGSAGIARQLMQDCKTAALATTDVATGAAYASLVTVALSGDGAPLLLISKLARHTRNLAHNNAGSLLFAEANVTGGDPLAIGRVTVTGSFVQLEDAGMIAHARDCFLARHPDAAVYASFADFGWWQMQMSEVHLVGGFGKIETFPASALSTA